MSLLNVNQLRYGTPEGRVLQEGLDFNLDPKGLLLVTGSNGSGKSTLIRLLLGRQKPLKGTIRFNVEAKSIAYVPQVENTQVHMPLTLNDVLALSVRDYSADRAVSFGLLTKEQLKISWNTASGGEVKRTLLTRMLLRNPQVLVLDEPMNHLDTASRTTVIGFLARFLQEGSQEFPRAILMVCHHGIHPEEEKQFSLTRLHLKSPDEQRRIT